MELLFETKRVEYLRENFFETISQEETGETIVPDSCPDVERIIDAFGTAVLRGKEYRNGSIVLSGGVHAGVLYGPEGGTAPRVLHCYLPFTIRFESDGLTENTRAAVDLRVRSVDARVLNSRKVLVRASLCGSVTGWEEAGQELYSYQPGEGSDLQIRAASYPILRPLETAEKPFRIAEEAELPGGRAPMRELCRCQAGVEIVESKLVGTKGVFKGNLALSLLYMTEDDELVPWSCQLPFSQYVDFEREHDGQELQAEIALTDFNVEDANGQGKRLLLDLQLLAQCTVLGQESIDVIEDAYSLRHDFTPQWTRLDAAGRLDRQTSAVVVRAEADASEVRTVLDTRVGLGDPVVRREGDRVTATVPLTANVLYRDEAGMLQSTAARMEAQAETELAEDCTCRASARLSGEPFAVPAGDGLEVRCTVEITMDSRSAGGLQTLSGGQLGDAPLDGEDRPSVILRAASPSDTLWSLAKRCRTTPESIRAANALPDDPARLTGTLLIPIAK